MELVRCQPFDDFPIAGRGVEDKLASLKIQVEQQDQSAEKESTIYLHQFISVLLFDLYIGRLDLPNLSGEVKMERTYLQGDLYFADLGQGVGSEQEGYRPVVIIQNNTGNRHSPTRIVTAISSKVGVKAKLPTHYFIDGEDGLDMPSFILLEQIRTIDKRRLDRYIGHLRQKNLDGLNHALAVSVTLIPGQPQPITLYLCSTCAENLRRTGTFSLYRVDLKQQDKNICSYCHRRSGYDYEMVAKARNG